MIIVIGILVDAVAEVVYLKRSEIETTPNVGNDEKVLDISGLEFTIQKVKTTI